MDKKYFIELLRKYSDGKTTLEERRVVEAYYELFLNEPDGLKALGPEEKEALKNSIRQGIGEVTEIGEITGGAKVRWFGPATRRWTAAAIISGVLLTGTYYLLNKPAEKQIAADHDIAVQPNENRIIFLADGSSVVLSQGSRLNYPSSFDGMDKREVFLEGQAFFDIRPNASKQFIVHTGRLKTIVLGTSFNIRAMPGEPDITVTVKTGKVGVSDQQNKMLGIITPDQQITWHGQTQHVELNRIVNDSYLRWKDRDLFVDNATLSEAAKLLEDRYHVRVMIADSSISSQRFTATFSKDESFEQAIQSICVFNQLDYKLNDQKSTVTILNHNR